ncbi:MAG: hypothetical protein OXF49_01425 [Candidatus Saccharibacteria bacterium]|nr:hypothetical protein [Candidatus Saccharibacteria bacterium]
MPNISKRDELHVPLLKVMQQLGGRVKTKNAVEEVANFWQLRILEFNIF